MRTRLVIIGGVAAGATAAARARRIAEDAEITLVERGPYVSYANCGLPYFIAGDIKKRSALLLQTPEGFDARYAVRVLVNTEAISIDRAAKRVLVRSTGAGAGAGHPNGTTSTATTTAEAATANAAAVTELPYDKLILAQGGSPITPSLPGVEAPHVFNLWTVPDMDRLQQYLVEQKPKTAAIIGGGFIGLEMAEAFAQRGLSTTVVEMLPTVMAAMDPEFGRLIAAELESHQVRVITGAAVTRVLAAPQPRVELADGRLIDADVVLFSVGVRPELTLAKQAGLTLGPSGGLWVDQHMRTSDPDIYAAGDMIEVIHRVSGRQARIPLAGPANRQGRLAASNALGMPMAYNGSLGTSAVKVFAATAAATGLSEKVARGAGFEVGVAVIHKDHHAGYYPGAEEMSLKLVYDRRTSRLLGAQAVGLAGIDKRMDVLATALAGKLTLQDLAELDLAYAPPYSSANDPINLAAFIGLNDLSGFSPLVTAGALKAEMASPTPPFLLDVRTLGEFDREHVKGARNIAVDDLRFESDQLPANRRLAVYCRSGYRGHLAVRILKGRGFSNVVNVTGGFLSIATEGGFELEKG